MVIKLRVKEQTISLLSTKSIPRIGSKDYLVLQFVFSTDWDNLSKIVYLQKDRVSEPIELVDDTLKVPEWFTEQDTFNVTLLGVGDTKEVPTNVVSIKLEKSNTLWNEDAPAPQPSWLVTVLETAKRVEEAVVNPPKIGSNGNWWTWDFEAGKYVDTGVAASGGGSGAVSSVNGKTGAVKLTAEDVGAVPVPETASVGQTIRIKAVDETGRPTEWEAADMASGDEWETINEIVLSEAVSLFTVSEDKNGNPFALDEMLVFIEYPFRDESRPSASIYYNLDTVANNWSSFTIPNQQQWIFVIEYSASLGCTRHAGYQYGNTLYPSYCSISRIINNDDSLYHTPANILKMSGSLEAGVRIVIAGRRAK